MDHMTDSMDSEVDDDDVEFGAADADDVTVVAVRMK